VGAYASLPSPDGVWAWKRGEGHVAAVNLGTSEATVELAGTILVATDRGRDGERVDSSLTLGASEGAVLEL
jgi:hypothetical protein